MTTKHIVASAVAGLDFECKRQEHHQQMLVFSPEYQVIGLDIRMSFQRIGALPFVLEEDFDL